MKCQSLFSWKKISKKYFKISSAELSQRVVKVKELNALLEYTVNVLKFRTP